MKTFIFVIGTIFFFACSKSDKDEVKETDNYTVNFNMSVFSQSEETWTKAVPIIMSKMYIVKYLVFTETGFRVKHITQTQDSETFGQIKDDLPEGNYKIILYASTSDSPVDAMDYKSAYVDISKYYAGEMYMSTFDITVNSAIDKDVILERIVGRLDLEISDLKQAFDLGRIDRIEYNIYNSPSQYGLISQKGSGEQTNRFFDRSNPSIFSVPLTNATVTIEGYKNFVSIYKKTIKNVNVYKNKITVLKGKLMSNSNTGSMTLMLNDQWGETVYQNF